MKGVQIRRVCASCNNGWMSRIEAAAKPVLLPMIRGEAKVLSAGEQFEVARWGYMKGLVAGAAMKQFETAYAARWFYDRKTAPPDCVVSLAAYPGSRHSLYMSAGPHKSTVRIDGREPRPNHIAYTATLCIGHFVIQVFDHQIEGATLEPAGPRRLLTQVVWPQASRTVAWPPPKGLSDRGLFEFGRTKA
jgi:hypothetical protein